MSQTTKFYLVGKTGIMPAVKNGDGSRTPGTGKAVPLVGLSPGGSIMSLVPTGDAQDIYNPFASSVSPNTVIAATEVDGAMWVLAADV